MAISDNVVGWVVILGILLVVIAIGTARSRKRKQKEKLIIDNGVQANATVVEIIDTGSRSNQNPVCRVIYSVEPEGEPAFRAETKMVLSPVDLTKFREGTVVRVAFDPRNRSEVVVIA